MRSIISTFTALLLVLPSLSGCDSDDGSDDGSNGTGSNTTSNSTAGGSNGGSSDNTNDNSNAESGENSDENSNADGSTDNGTVEDEVEAWLCICTYDCDGVADVWDADALCLSDEEAQLVVDVAADECLAEFDEVCEALECDCECEVDDEFTCE